MFDDVQKSAPSTGAEPSIAPVDMFKETDTEVPRISSTQAQSQAVVPRVPAAGEHLRPHRGSFVSGKAALIAGGVVIILALAGFGIQFMLANAKKQAAEQPLIEQSPGVPTTETVQGGGSLDGLSAPMPVPGSQVEETFVESDQQTPPAPDAEQAPTDGSLVPEPAVVHDLDGDGLDDYEEQLLGTDPAKQDSDGDSYLDGEEVQNGYNPLGPGKMTDEQKSKLPSP